MTRKQLLVRTCACNQKVECYRIRFEQGSNLVRTLTVSDDGMPRPICLVARIASVARALLFRKVLTRGTATRRLSLPPPQSHRPPDAPTMSAIATDDPRDASAETKLTFPETWQVDSSGTSHHMSFLPGGHSSRSSFLRCPLRFWYE